MVREKFGIEEAQEEEGREEESRGIIPMLAHILKVAPYLCRPPFCSSRLRRKEKTIRSRSSSGDPDTKHLIELMI